MATPGRRTGASLVQRLEKEPYQFEFFQAVRLLEFVRRERIESGADTGLVPVGENGPPGREPVRFAALPSHAFPGCEVTSIEFPESARPASGSAADRPLAKMQVAFMGLTGPGGVLPQHYTQTVIDRVRSRDTALRDFLDIFNHRAISLFYRAWEKYRLPLAVERAALDARAADSDPFRLCLRCLVGLGTGGLQGRLEIDDETFLFFSGHFAHQPPSVAAIEAMVGDYFQLPVRVLQFQGQWLYLDAEDRSVMPSPAEPRGRNRSLGRNVVVGQRVWSIENRFRIQLGPLGYAEFCRFMPNGDALRPISQLIRSYVGPEHDFDIQPVLKAAETPRTRLGGRRDDGSLLGWNTWMQSKPREADAREAIFEDDGFPRSS
jgi:type VI secretion system protein ImpH